MLISQVHFCFHLSEEAAGEVQQESMYIVMFKKNEHNDIVKPSIIEQLWNDALKPGISEYLLSTTFTNKAVFKTFAKFPDYIGLSHHPDIDSHMSSSHIHKHCFIIILGCFDPPGWCSD